MVTDRYHIYRWMGLFRASDKIGSFMGRGKIAEYQIPGTYFTSFTFTSVQIPLVILFLRLGRAMLSIEFVGQ